MEQLTAALLSCPIPASYALGSTADREGNCEVRSRPRLGCAAVSLAGLEGLSSPAAATTGASSSSTSERTPEMVQERGEGAGVHSSMQFSSISSPINLVLQAASKPAAADHTATGVLLQPPGGGYLLQEQRRLEMLRKVLDEHNINVNGSTDAFYSSSSSMSIRSVSTEASSVPHTAASTEKALAGMSLVSAAQAGHLFPATSLCLDSSSRCSPFSSPASAASPPAVSSPPLSGPLSARTATANGFVSREITRAKRCSLFPETAVAAHRVMGEEWQSSPRAEGIADAAGTFSEVDSSAFAAAAAALTAASAVDVITASVGQHQHQEQRLAKIAVNGCELPSHCSERAQSPPAPEAATAAVVNAALNTASKAHSTMAAAAAQALAEVLAETSLATADASCVSAEKISEAAAAYALLAAAGTAREQMAAPEGGRTLGLPLQHFVSNAADQVADNGGSGKQSERIEKTARHRQQGGGSVVIAQPGANLSNVISVGGEAEGNGESSASLAGEKQSDFQQTCDTAANAQAAAGAAVIGVDPASAASVRNINSAVVAPGGGVSAAAVDMPACSDTTDLDVATCCSGRSDSSPVAAATGSDSRRDAFGAPPSQGERTARKKRLRDLGDAGSRKESVDSVAASAASVSPGTAATELLPGSADSKDCVVPAAAIPFETARKFSKEEEDSSGREETAQVADATLTPAAAEGSGEESHSCRKKEKRSDTAGSAAAAPLFTDMDVDKNLPSAGAAAAASTGGEMHEQRQRTKQLQRDAGELCTFGNGDSTSQVNKSATQASTTCGEGGGSGHVNLLGKHGTSTGREGLLQKECGATSPAVGAAPAVGDDARVPMNVAATEKDEKGADIFLAAEGAPGVARRKPTHDEEGGAGGVKNKLCMNDVTETGGHNPPSGGEAQQSGEAGKTSQMSEQIGYLAATTYLSGGAAARGGATSTTGCPERSEQECSTMCCNSRNSSGELLALSGALRSSGELLALSGALRAESAQQQQGQQQQASVLQELYKKHKEEERVEQQPAEQVVSPREGAYTPENRERNVVSGDVSAENGSSRTAAPAAAGGDNEGVESEESETLAERSKKRSEKNASIEIENIAVSTQSRLDDTEERTALVQDKQEEEQPEPPRFETLQQSQGLEQQEKKPRNEPQQQHHHQQQQRHLVAQQLETKPQPDEEEDEMALQVARDCVMGGDNDVFNASWERMGDDSGAVPPLHAYKSLSWTEGFSLPLGKIGRQKLLRQVRLKYHRNRDHWRAKLHEKGFDVTSLPRMGVEQLWAVAQQMDLFDVACIIAHEHATRRQHRGGGGGGSGLHAGAVAGQQQHYPQQAAGDCDEGGGAEVAAAVAAALAAGRGGTGVRGRGDGDCASVASALLSSTTGGVEAATLSHLPSLIKGGASLRSVCTDKTLKNALSLLAENAAAAGAMSYTACKSGQPEHEGERSRNCQQQQRLRGGGAGVKETAWLHSTGGSNGSIHGSNSITQDRCSRSRCRHKAGEPRNANAAGATNGSTAAHGRHEAAPEVATAEAEEEQDIMGEGGEEAGCKEEMCSATLAAAGTEPTEEEEEEEEVGGDHPLLLLQEDEAENTGQQMHEDFREDSALLLLQPPHGRKREKLYVEEATTQEGGSEGGRKVVFRDSACGVRARKQEEAAVATEKGRRDCSIFFKGEPCGGPDGQATAAVVAAATVDAARTTGWPSRGTSRRSKKKTRQEQVPSCGSVVGELLSKVCAEALREAVASAADVSSPRYSLPLASSSACLRALEGLTEAATTEQPPRMADAASAAASVDDVEAAAAATAAAIKRPAAEADGAAGMEREENFREADLQRAQVAEGASSSCGHLRKKSWVDTEGELSAYSRQHKWLKQQEDRQEFLDTRQLESAVEEEGVCSSNTEDMVRLCAAIAQHAEDRKLDSYREGCRSLAHLGPEDAEELALFLQQHFAAAASTCIAEEGAQGENGVLRVSDSGAVAFATAGPCKEGKGWGAAGLHGQEMTYEGSSSGAAPTRVIKGRQRSQRERQREEKDRRQRSSHGDSGHVRPTAVQIEETEDETANIRREMPRTAEVVQDAYSAGDDSVVGSSRLAAAEPCTGMARFGPASNPTVAGVTRSAKEAASLAAAVDLFWMARSISDEELKRGQGEEGVPTSLSLDKEMLDGVASTLRSEEGKIRKEVEALAETRRCMREALTEIYLQLDNGIEEGDSPIAKDKEGDHLGGAAEKNICRPLTTGAGNNKPAANTTPSAAIAAAGACAVDADAARVEEAVVPATQAAAEAKATCEVVRSGCANTRLARGCWGCLFPPEEPDGTTRRERRTCSEDRSDSCCHLKSGSEGRGPRESVACGEGTSALRSGRDGGGQPVQRREARARGCLDAQLAERLQQRVNDLQGQLDEVKVQLHQLLKLNDAAELLSAAVLADEARQQHVFTRNALAADCGTRLSPRAEEAYRSRSLIGG